MKEYFAKNRINILIIFAFLILPFIFFEGILHLNSIILGMRDAQYGFLPAHDLKIQIIKNLELPLWDRYIFGGYPMLATPSDSALYPIDLILGLIFPVTLSYNLSILFHYSLAGIFLFFFMREYDLDRLSCFVSGLIFMFSGMMITNRDQTTRIYTMVWIPLILLFLEKYRKSKKFEFILVSSIFYAISFFAGDPQLFLYSSIIILFFILYYSFVYEGARNYFFLFSLAVFLLGTLIISVQLVPAIFMTQNSYRNAISYSYFSDFSFDPKLLPVLFFPFFFGRGSYVIPGVPEYFGYWNAGEMIRYFGILTIPLLILGIFKRNKHKYLWIFVMAFALLLVFGRNTEFYKLMFHVPLYNKFRVPTRNWFEFGFAFSILTAFGFDSLIKRDERTKRILIGAVSFISVVLFSFILFIIFFRNAVANGAKSFLIKGTEFKLLYQNLVLNNYSVYIPFIILIATIIFFIILIFKKNKKILVLLIIFIFLDLFSWGHFMDRPRNVVYVQKDLKDAADLKFLTDEQPLFRIYPKAKELEDFKFYPNMNIHYDIESISGHDPLLLKSVGKITSFPQDPDSGVDWKKLLRNNVVLSMLNTEYIILDNPSDMEMLLKDIGENYEVVFENKDNLVLKNMNYLDRFYFVEKILTVRDIDQAKEILWKEYQPLDINKFDPAKIALVENFDCAKKQDFTVSNSKVEIISYKNNSVELKSITPDNEFLVFSEDFDKGWQAFIDGNKTAIYRTNGMLEGLPVPKGTHEIVFRYRPPYFLITGIISAISLFLILGISSFLFIRKRKKI